MDALHLDTNAYSAAKRGDPDARYILGHAPRVEVMPVEVATAALYAAVYRQLRRDGRPVPTNDMWIAAAVLSQPDGVLYTLDDHFRAVVGLRVVSNADQFQALYRSGPQPSAIDE